MLSPEYLRFQQTKFFSSLDGLRALSILGVIWFHTGFGAQYYEYFNSIPVLREGAFGVDIFFAISGFLITTLLLREQRRNGCISLRDFYIRRTLRIWPLYYAVLGLYVVLVLMLEHGTDRGHQFFKYLPSYFTFTYTWFGPQGDEPGAIFNFAWSLATEEQFYLFWPFLLAFLPRPGPVIVMIALILARLAFSFGWLSSVLPPETLSARIAGSLAVPICLGALLAHALHFPRWFDAIFKLLGRPLAAPAALALLAAAPVPRGHGGHVLAWFVLPLLLGACVIREDNGLSRVLALHPIAFIGMISYGMYMFNTLCIRSVRPVAGQAGIAHPLLTFPLSLAGTAAVAYLSFKYFEYPFLKLKQRFERLSRPPMTQAAVQIRSEVGERVHP